MMWPCLAPFEYGIWQDEVKSWVTHIDLEAKNQSKPQKENERWRNAQLDCMHAQYE